MQTTKDSHTSALFGNISYPPPPPAPRLAHLFSIIPVIVKGTLKAWEG